MDWVNVIQETLRYVEANLLTVTSPKEVALAVHVSVSYLQTSFPMITGFSIGEYIRNRRLYLAAMELLEKAPATRLAGKGKLFSSETRFREIPRFAKDTLEDLSGTPFMELAKSGLYGVSVGETDAVLNAEGKPWLSDYSEGDRVC